MTLLNDIQVWTPACAYDRLLPCRGAGVLLPDGQQAAIFRLDDGVCMDDPAVAVPVFRTRITAEGYVEVCS